MKEIKFRTYDKLKKEFRYLDLREAIKADLCFTLCYYNNCNVGYCKCDIMQFTGLKDKNGTDIYEGDIVKTVDGIGTVIFCKEMFVISWSDPESLFEWIRNYNMSGITVIGNIYENHELLDNEKEN